MILSQISIYWNMYWSFASHWCSHGSVEARQGKARQKPEAEWEFNVYLPLLQVRLKTVQAWKWQLEILSCAHNVLAVYAHLQAFIAFVFICTLSGTLQYLIFSGVTLSLMGVGTPLSQWQPVVLPHLLWLNKTSARCFWNLSLVGGRGGEHLWVLCVTRGSGCFKCQLLCKPRVSGGWEWWGWWGWCHKNGEKGYK